jgi:hypothetical protein
MRTHDRSARRLLSMLTTGALLPKARLTASHEHRAAYVMFITSMSRQHHKSSHTLLVFNFQFNIRGLLCYTVKYAQPKHIVVLTLLFPLVVSRRN